MNGNIRNDLEQSLISTRSFEQVVFCNYCHSGPAAGIIETEVDGEIVGRTACLECADKEGAVVTGKVVADADL